MSEFTNRLINEKSPYLLQHAYNPVDWFPWGDEAFSKAKNEDKPLFLSIGYSSCHWCHVMERESFEDTEVADFLNKHFISIKVDREERPDVDHFYMEACMAFTGQGGWPMSSFLSEDKTPFFAGTYFPKVDKYGVIGFLNLLKNIIALWEQDREKLFESKSFLLKSLSQKDTNNQIKLDEDISNIAFRQYESSFDKQYGGFGSAPKFPASHNLLFLMRYGIAGEKNKALEIVNKTLESMYNGGIYDHIGGGFCRYSTDRKWLVPHFEKMMYDNAMLAITYCEAGATINKKYFDVSKDIINFCFKEMRSEEGGFYTAQDADSEGEEGKFYVFSPIEIEEVLNSNSERFCKLYDITDKGNFEGKNIPNLIVKNLSKEDESFAKGCKELLYISRKKRIPPFKDDKFLASNNALMLVALSIASRLVDNELYIDDAKKTVDFIFDNLIINDRLYASNREKVTAHLATSDDYAYLAWGLFELYETTFNPKWLIKSARITKKMLELFWDDKNGGLFLSGNDVQDLPIRGKNTHDGALPSGNSVAASVLIRLSSIIKNESYMEKAQNIIDFVAGDISSYPIGYAGFLSANLLMKHQKSVIIVNGESSDEIIKLSRTYQPFASFLLCGEGYEDLNKLYDYNSFKTKDNKATVYICAEGTCYPPLNDISKIKELLSK